MRGTGSGLARRSFLQGSLGLGGLALLAGCGMPPAAKVARIGVLALARGDDPARLRLVEAFLQGLREHGWVEGQNLVVEWRSGETRAERLPGLAAELVRLQPDVLVSAAGATTLRPLLDVTARIPIVVPAYGGDPVADGIAASLARPGGNVTGMTLISPDLSGKKLELLKAVVPGLSRLAVLWNATTATTASDWRETQAAARVLGVRLLALPVRGPDDFADAFATAGAEAPDALLALPDVITYTYRARIIEFAAKARLPAMYGQREPVDDGGLMAYGPNLPDMWRRAGTYIDKILKGANPAEFPIERPTRFDFVINVGTAQALGLTIPQSVLQQVTELVR